MPKAYKYKGVLAKPRENVLPLGYWAHPDDPEWQAKGMAAAQAQHDSLVAALFADCGVSQSDPLGWCNVALTLARRHVKAFQPGAPNSRGRPSKRDWELVDEVLEIVRSRSLSIRSASAIIAKRKRLSARSIENSFHVTMRAGRKAEKELEALFPRLREK
jgi:hypothetical protein